MTDDLVLVERRDDGVATLRLNRPPLNALNGALLVELRHAAESLAADAAVKAVVVLGGERAFAAGADVSEFGDAEAAAGVAARFRGALDALASIPRPVLAAVNGFALGGGMEVALACDLRVAGSNARMGQPEVLLGVMPGAGGTQRLARLVGPARAKELCWSGRQLRPDEALAMGLVDRVVDAARLEEEALAWASSLAGGAVVAMGLIKQAVDEGLDRSLAEGLDLEAELFVDVFRTQDAATGVRSFREQGPGKATFAGR